MKIKKFFAQKKPAQAMVEFAIALPVLLLLLYGILEAGRYLFLYSTVVTASRQAARYGTATGDGGGTTPVYGPSRPVVPRYKDCAGIKGAANAVAYLTRGGFNLTIAWDKGPEDTNPDHGMCTSNTPEDTSGTPNPGDLTGNATRIIVTASTQFVPLVKLVPFAPRMITATSARTILYSVPIQVDQAFDPVAQSMVNLTISVSPEPSEIGQPVTISVSVSDADAPSDPQYIPKGDVVISGGFDGGTCTIHLSGGTGTCPATFSFDAAVTYPNTYTLTGVYTPGDGDVDHLSSKPGDIGNNPGTHVVTKSPTTTQITGVAPDSAFPNENVTFYFKVTNVTTGVPTPSGTVKIVSDDGATCTGSLDGGGTGNCVIRFASSGLKKLTATYSGDNTHQGSTSTTVGYQVSDVPPTPKPTGTATAKPSATPTATAAPSSTPVPSPVPNCSGINHGAISYTDTTMTMTVTNPFLFTLTMSDVTVTWNDDKGHKAGNDKTLVLLSAAVNGKTFWTGTSALGESTKTLSGPASFPPGTSTITFTFDKSYDNPETTDRIVINWLTPGCGSNGVDSNQ